MANSISTPFGSATPTPSAGLRQGLVSELHNNPLNKARQEEWLSVPEGSVKAFESPEERRKAPNGFAPVVVLLAVGFLTSIGVGLVLGGTLTVLLAVSFLFVLQHKHALYREWADKNISWRSEQLGAPSADNCESALTETKDSPSALAYLQRMKQAGRTLRSLDLTVVKALAEEDRRKQAVDKLLSV